MKKILPRIRHEFKKIAFFAEWIIFLFTEPVSGIRHFIMWVKSKKTTELGYKPWLTFKATDWIDSRLTPKMKIFEWGSGSSTLYLSKKVSHIYSVEHNAVWFKRINTLLKDRKILNCTYFLSDDTHKNYTNVINKYPDEYFDMIIIDGIHRLAASQKAVKKVKKGGYIILDNSERKEYEQIFTHLKDWKLHSFWGQGPINYYKWETSIFIKPER